MRKLWGIENCPLSYKMRGWPGAYLYHFLAGGRLKLPRFFKGYDRIQGSALGAGQNPKNEEIPRR